VAVEIIVRDGDGAPLPSVTIELESGGWRKRQIVTGEDGRALLLDGPPGVLTLRARSIGYKQGSLAVMLGPGRNTIPIVLDKVRLPALDTVRVMGGRRFVARHEEFELRRLRAEATASFTEDEIAKRNILNLSELLRTVHGVRIDDNGGKPLAISGRGMKYANGQMVPCVMAVMVDGVALPEGSTPDAIPPAHVYGLEVFAGPASIPSRLSSMLNGNSCGLIAIWTR
jgi:hypothetical protein